MSGNVVMRANQLQTKLLLRTKWPFQHRKRTHPTGLPTNEDISNKNDALPINVAHHISI